MYGMVNQAVRGLILEKFGSETWSKIHSSVGSPESFSAMEPYDDSITYSLVVKSSEVLGLPADVILKTFGEYWVKEIASVHYEKIMKSSGVTFADFLANLDHMHQRIRVTFPNYNPPSFRVKSLDPSTLQVDYYSHREGLIPFVEGLFSGLAEYFSVQIQIEHLDGASHGLPCKRMMVRHSHLKE